MADKKDNVPLFADYQIIRHGYFEEFNLRDVGNLPLEEIKRHCDNDDNCLAFCSNGKLKYEILPFQYIDTGDTSSTLHTYVKNTPTGKVRCKYPFELHLHQQYDIISYSIRVSYCWEPRLSELIIELSEYYKDSGLPFVDVGANIGYYSIMAAKVGMNVIAIEPLPDNIEIFQKSLGINSSNAEIKLLNFAVGEEQRDVTMSPQNCNLGASKIASDGSGRRVVQMKTLDELLRLESRIAFLKMDIEGFEWRAIKGAKLLFLDNLVDFFIVEIDLGEDKIDQIMDGVAFLTQNCAYEMYYLGNEEYGTIVPNSQHIKNIVKGGGRIHNPAKNPNFLSQVKKDKPDNFAFLSARFIERFTASL